MSFLFIVRERGEIVVPGFEAWPFDRRAFPAVPKTLVGVSCRVLSVQELLHDKLHHEEWSGRRLRPKDRESMELLRSLGG